MTWINDLTGSIVGSMNTLDLLLQLVLTSTIVLLIGLVITRLAARRSAAARHLLWLLVFAGMAVAPVVVRIWPIEPILIGGFLRQEYQAEPQSIDVAADEGEFADFYLQELQARQSISPNNADQVLEASTRIRDSSAVPTDRQTQKTSDADISWVTHVQAWIPLFLGVWMSGVALISSLLVIGQLELRKERRSFRLETDEILLTALRRVADELGVKRKITLFQSNQRSIPMTWGIRSPAIVLPSLAKDWPNERLRMVLLHEVAHVRRFDCLWQPFVLLVVATHWFHPLVWVALMRMRAECEQACDDVVLSSGVPGSKYAAQLLDISTGGHRGVLALCAGMAIARSHRLSGRVQAIVDSDRNRCPVSRGSLVVCITATLALVVPITSLTNVTFQGRAANVEAAQGTQTRQVAASETRREHPSAVLPDGSTFDLNATHQPFIDSVIRLVESASIEAEGAAPAIPDMNLTLKLHTPLRIRQEHLGPDVVATEVIIGTQKVLGPNYVFVRSGRLLRVFAKYNMADWVAFRSELASLQHHSLKVIANESGEWSKPVNGLAACLNVTDKVGVLLELRNRSDADSMTIPIDEDRLDFRLFDPTGTEQSEFLLPSDTSFGQTGDIRLPLGSPLKIHRNSSVGIVRWRDTGAMLVFYNPQWLSGNNSSRSYTLGATIKIPRNIENHSWHGSLDVPPVSVRFIRREKQMTDPISIRRYSIAKDSGTDLQKTLSSLFPQRASLTFSYRGNTNEITVHGPASQQEFARQFIDALNNAAEAPEFQESSTATSPKAPLADASTAAGESASAVSQAEPRSRIYSFTPNAKSAGLRLIADENTIADHEFLGAPVMSHDGNWVLFDATKGRTFAKTRLIKVAVAGANKGKVIDLGYGVCGSFSPDDAQIAFFLNNKVPSGDERGIWVMDADGKNRRRVTNGCHPHWSPDGKSLLTVTSFRSPRQLTLVEVATGKRTRLLRNEIVLGQPAWSPDGKQIAITVQDNDERVLCLFKPERESTDRKEVWRQPFSQKYEETWPDWSSDGESLVFTVWDRITGGILIVDVAAGSNNKPKRADEIPQTTSIRDCQWASNGKQILFATDSDTIHALATPL